MKHYQQLKYIYLAFCFLIITGLCYADSSPVNMLQTISNQMLSQLSQTTNRNENTLFNMVNKILLPHVDLEHMSAAVVGQYWLSASPSQKQQFKNQFVHFITRTYSNALSAYQNQTVRFLPLRNGISGNRVQVNSVIEQENGRSISVSYRLLSQPNADWKIYDFSVENVSIVENYRSQFASVLRTAGLSGLNQKLAQQNQKQ